MSWSINVSTQPSMSACVAAFKEKVDADVHVPSDIKVSLCEAADVVSDHWPETPRTGQVYWMGSSGHANNADTTPTGSTYYGLTAGEALAPIPPAPQPQGDAA